MPSIIERIGDARHRRTALLAGSALGVYLLVVVGATTSVLEAGTACHSWPTCNGRLLPSFEPMAILAWGHRALGLVVGILLVVTLLTVWRHDRMGVRAAVTGAAVLYPVQTLIGAAIAVNGASVAVATIHLTVAVTIFTSLLVGLLWHLEAAEHGARSTSRTDTTDAGTPVDPAVSPVDSRLGIAKAYLRLTKPRLWWLLALVAVAAMALAAGPSLSAYNVLATVTGGVLAIAASGTFNNLLERERDRQMERTADRPLLNGTIRPRHAWVYGASLTIASMVVFIAFVNVLAAALGFLAILYYSVVYTLLLKPNTEKNIAIGGAVGGFPALIGWAAVTNTVGLPSLALGAVVVLWTPAHFYNLALAYKEDYSRADFPMLPIVSGEAVTRRHILLYFGATMVGAITLGMADTLSWLYAAVIVVAGVVFLWAIVRLFEERTDAAAFRTFHAANAYLGLLLFAVVVDALVLL